MTDHDYRTMRRDIEALVYDRYGNDCKVKELEIGKSEIMKKDTITLKVEMNLNGETRPAIAIKETINEVMAEIDKQLSCTILEKHYL